MSTTGPHRAQPAPCFSHGRCLLLSPGQGSSPVGAAVFYEASWERARMLGVSRVFFGGRRSHRSPAQPRFPQPGDQPRAPAKAKPAGAHLLPPWWPCRGATGQPSALSRPPGQPLLGAAHQLDAGVTKGEESWALNLQGSPVAGPSSLPDLGRQLWKLSNGAGWMLLCFGCLLGGLWVLKSRTSLMLKWKDLLESDKFGSTT